MYATIDEIKASSKRVPTVIGASPSDLQDWMEEAAEAINTFCSQDFLFEQQTTKRVLADDSLVILPKNLSGKISVTVDGGDLVNLDDLEHVAGEFILRYRPLNVVNWGFARAVPTFLLITGDWGYPSTQDELLVAYANELKTRYNTHRLDTGVHYAADGTNVITAADATDLSSAITLLNDALVQVNAHFADVTVHVVADTDIVTAVSATDTASATALAAAIDAAWTKHIKDTDSHTDAPALTDKVSASVNNPIRPRSIKRTFIKLVKRLSIRDDEEDLYNRNSGYVTETTGDGYNYSLADGTLRSLIQPEDFAALWPHKNDGRLVL